MMSRFRVAAALSLFIGCLASWSMEVVLKTTRSETYKNSLTWK